MNYSKLNIRSTYNRQTSIRKPRLGAALAAEQLDDRVLLSVACRRWVISFRSRSFRTTLD